MSAEGTDNQLRVFRALDQQMHILHNDGDPDKREEAERIAHMLLEYTELPLKLRCRSLMVLGLSLNDGYLEWAQEAVRIAELGMANLVGEANENDHELLEHCRKVLQLAQEDFAEAQEDMEEPVEDVDNEDDEDGELIFSGESEVINGEVVTKTHYPKPDDEDTVMDEGLSTGDMHAGSPNGTIK